MISDPQAIRFVNEAIRPLAEQLRLLKANITSASNSWTGGVSALIPNSAAEIVGDGRDAEGISRLTGADVHALVTALTAVLNAGTSAVVSKPCVRPILV